MGSINCKESKKNDSCAPDVDNGTSGTYQYISTETPKAENNIMTEYTDAVTVCKETDIQENEMKKVPFDDDTNILLIKQNGRLTAIGNKCSHYGAPLHTGVLGQGRVRCPWHGACFNIETGDIEDFPGLDAVPCYKVDVSADGLVKVRAKIKDLESTKRVKDMAKMDPEDKRVFVVVGGGPAGGVCVEALRQEGFAGRIVMLCREAYLPYDRVKVSKSMDTKIETIQFRKQEFYDTHSIETWIGVAATKLDALNKTVHCSNGQALVYDKIFIATGCRPAKPPITGADLKNVFCVRDFADSEAIMETLKPEMNVVCLGSSFIALESAAFLVKKAKTMTVVARDAIPLRASFGEHIGQRILKQFRENNVIMQMNSGITEILSTADGKVSDVMLKDGTKLPCDILIMGTGSKFYTDFMKDSGVDMNANGSVDADLYLTTNMPDVYVGGDIANAPVYSIGNQKATIGHYQLAQYHGQVAAINMIGKKKKQLEAVPFFFTMLFGKGFRYSGYGSYADVYIEGDLENFKFVAYFLDPLNNVVAVASCQRDPIVAQFAELQSQGKRLNRSDIEGKENPTEWTKMLHEPLSC